MDTGDNGMGLVYENITLKNAGDVSDVRRGFIKEPEIRQIKVLAMVDTGAEMLVISDAIRQELGLEVLGQQQIRLANDAVQICQFTEPVEVHWKDRYTFTQALVLAGVNEVLLGAIPLEGMNVIVDPAKRQLAGAYGDEIIYKVK
jgi:clan AA aspartic protease